ncbi:MAG: hypothetical protein ACP5JN_02620 [Candidatus Micrarchaeia archaeon]
MEDERNKIRGYLIESGNKQIGDINFRKTDITLLFPLKRQMHFEDITTNFKIFAESLVESKAVLKGKKPKSEKGTEIPILFSSNDKDILSVINKYEFENVDTYMKAGKIYRLDKVRQADFEDHDSKVVYKLVKAYFEGEDGHKFIFHVVFKNNENENPYIDRIYSFFSSMENFKIIPKHNIGPIFSSSNINMIFPEFSQIKSRDDTIYEEPRMKKGNVYHLFDVGRLDNAVVLEYFDTTEKKKLMMRIECYRDDENVESSRKLSKVYEFFAKQKGKLFAPAEDVYDCEFDFMKVPAHNEPFILRFGEVHNSKEFKEVLHGLKIDSENAKWNEVHYNSYAWYGVKSYPDRIL